MTYTAQSCREEAAINDKFGDPIMNDPDILRAHADALDKLASIEAAQGEDVRGPVERLKEARRIVWSMCADGRPPRMSIPAEDTDEDVFIVDTITATIALLESLPAKLAAQVAFERNRANAINDRFQSSMDNSDRIASEWMHACRRAEAQLAERDAELAALKGHAEAMAEGIESSHLEIEQEALAAYRAAYPEGK